MNNGRKIVVTILLIIGYFIVSGILAVSGARASGTFIGLLAIGLFYSIRAVWKKKEDEPSDSSEIKLNKTNSQDKDITSNK